jgi:hypothetical protein
MVRAWLAEDYPNVLGGDPHMNRVTIVVDAGGRFVQSFADSVSSEEFQDRSATRRNLARLAEDAIRRAGVDSIRVMNTMLAHSRGGRFSKYPLSVIVLQLGMPMHRGGG